MVNPSETQAMVMDTPVSPCLSIRIKSARRAYMHRRYIWQIQALIMQEMTTHLLS